MLPSLERKNVQKVQKHSIQSEMEHHHLIHWGKNCNHGKAKETWKKGGSP
jgi:hypothetical protein